MCGIDWPDRACDRILFGHVRPSVVAFLGHACIATPSSVVIPGQAWISTGALLLKHVSREHRQKCAQAAHVSRERRPLSNRVATIALTSFGRIVEALRRLLLSADSRRPSSSRASKFSEHSAELGSRMSIAEGMLHIAEGAKQRSGRSPDRRLAGTRTADEAMRPKHPDSGSAPHLDGRGRPPTRIPAKLSGDPDWVGKAATVADNRFAHMQILWTDMLWRRLCCGGLLRSSFRRTAMSGAPALVPSEHSGRCSPMLTPLRCSRPGQTNVFSSPWMRAPPLPCAQPWPRLPPSVARLCHSTRRCLP